MVEETFEPNDQPFTDSVEPLNNETSFSFPSDNNEIQCDMTALYEQSSVTNDPDPQASDSIDNLLANLAEDNANSLPSVDVDCHFSSVVETRTIEELNFAEAGTTNLPNDFEIDAESSASSTSVAHAEDLPNGNSRATDADVDAEMVSEDELPAPMPEKVDAEMVSEDELPAPTQEKVDDAEEVSDEELPGPTMAELPADTEVVSEDELPATNKRKVDEGYDPGSPTESSEIPDKKTKQEVDDGKFLFDVEHKINYVYQCQALKKYVLN